jgi:hypothetical protein
MHRIELVKIYWRSSNIFGVRKPELTSLPTFIIEWEKKNQWEVIENKVVIFFPIQVQGPPQIYPRIPLGGGGSVDKFEVKNGGQETF